MWFDKKYWKDHVIQRSIWAYDCWYWFDQCKSMLILKIHMDLKYLYEFIYLDNYMYQIYISYFYFTLLLKASGLFLKTNTSVVILHFWWSELEFLSYHLIYVFGCWDINIFFNAQIQALFIERKIPK